ncbi:DNA (cytosine-5-)-methyltransferase [Tropicimonas sp. TH_r6]|uniref:DNA (cytosine-5-)-methyltransferase n=1 Tax=Tropicimonas sp. TH_r6 TaxID=3082085 RepID=UPI0029542490|nr:DNA (cytosine-5-)-methyltransferase [Tropicimonas sp. TH_r6]MDV7141762.1 DNA (cytosine-5-)-methyltransferase [Tropicimonas sp. TH_r6]
MKKTTESFRFIDLFAGIGGLRIGFEAIGGTCVFTSEWNKFSQETYRVNFPDDDHEIKGDITTINEEDVPVHDLLLAGFPCQPFSIAGVSKKNALGRAHGFADETQGTLFFDVVRMLRHHKPKAFLLENVKNLLSHDKGNTMRVILHALDELGYEVDYRVIDAQNWVPQHRERIFISGFRRNFSTNFTMEDVKIPDGERPLLKDILHPEDGSEISEPPFTVGPKAEVAEKYTLTPKLWDYLQRYAAKHKAAGNGFGFGLRGPEDVARTLSARYYKDGSEILIEQDGDIPRRLTPRECARLMGFDRPGNNRPWIIPVSDTQAYRQFGNAVAAPVAIAVASAMEPWLTNTVAIRSRKDRRA